MLYLSMKTTTDRNSIEKINTPYITALQRESIHRTEFTRASEKDDSYIAFSSTVLLSKELQFQPTLLISSTCLLRTVDTKEASYWYKA